MAALTEILATCCVSQGKGISSGRMTSTRAAGLGRERVTAGAERLSRRQREAVSDRGGCTAVALSDLCSYRVVLPAGADSRGALHGDRQRHRRDRARVRNSDLLFVEPRAAGRDNGCGSHAAAPSATAHRESNCRGVG